MATLRDENNSIPLHKSVWIAGLIIQGIAVALLGRFLITLDFPTNILSLLLLAGYLAIVFLTINLIRRKTTKSSIVIALDVLNVIATVISFGFLIYVIELFNTFTIG